ncbi:MAG: hypothetical protein Q8R37_03425 [Nanoarchaeota archaeon]|nr:hypothetical protein [Nanoarchaeota archaeon]
MTTKITAQGMEALKKQAFDNPEAVLVLADVLQSQGDPRGEFLALNYYLEHTDVTPQQRIDYSHHRKKVYQQFFRIESLDNRFRLQNVFYNGWFYTVDQSTKLLDDGDSHTQDRWLEWLNSDENVNKWQLPSGPLYHASVAALHYNQDIHDKKQRNLVQQCRAMHVEDFKKYWMMTSTRIQYNPQGLDTIIDDYGSSQPREIKMNFVGPDKYVRKDSGLEQEIDALLGTSDLEEVEQVYNGLTDKNPYLWRLNDKPNEETHRAFVLGGGIGGNFIVSAVGSGRPSRGWSVKSKQA